MTSTAKRIPGTLLALLALAIVAWVVCRPTPPSGLLEEYERRGWDSYELAGDLALDLEETDND